jgi:hypothetical protein
MDKRESDLERLLRAARGDHGSTPAMPYGFDTRVVALARGTQPDRGGSARELLRMFKSIAAGGCAVAIVAAVATYWQLQENDALAEPLSNAYAMVDTALSAELNE